MLLQNRLLRSSNELWKHLILILGIQKGIWSIQSQFLLKRSKLKLKFSVSKMLKNVLAKQAGSLDSLQWNTKPFKDQAFILQNRKATNKKKRGNSFLNSSHVSQQVLFSIKPLKRTQNKIKIFSIRPINMLFTRTLEIFTNQIPK
jgi:hypothetical protein